MLEETRVKVRYVRYIKVNFTLEQLARNTITVIKNYAVELPIVVDGRYLTQIRYNPGCTILLEIDGKLYYVPIIEDLMKFVKTDAARKTIARTIKEVVGRQSIKKFKFTYRQKEFVTQEVKRVLVEGTDEYINYKPNSKLCQTTQTTQTTQ